MKKNSTKKRIHKKFDNKKKKRSTARNIMHGGASEGVSEGVSEFQQIQPTSGLNSIEAKHPGFIGPATTYITNVGNNAMNHLPMVDNIKNTLSNILETLKNPEMRENIRNIIGEGATTLAIGLQASQPAIDQLISSVVEAIEKSANKIGNASVNVFMNTLEEIPGPGIFIGTIRSLDTIVKTIQSLVNAGSEVITANADTISEITEKIQQIKSQLMNKVQALSSKTDVLSRMTNNIPNPINFSNSMPSPMSMAATAKSMGINSINSINSNDISKQLDIKKNIVKQLGGSISEFHDSTLHPRNIIKNKKKHRGGSMTSYYLRSHYHAQ